MQNVVAELDAGAQVRADHLRDRGGAVCEARKLHRLNLHALLRELLLYSTVVCVDFSERLRLSMMVNAPQEGMVIRAVSLNVGVVVIRDDEGVVYLSGVHLLLSIWH